jgi:hypothetical protein
MPPMPARRSGAAVPSLAAGQLARVLSLFEIGLGYGALSAIACPAALARARTPHTPAVRHR